MGFHKFFLFVFESGLSSCWTFLLHKSKNMQTWSVRGQILQIKGIRFENYIGPVYCNSIKKCRTEVHHRYFVSKIYKIIIQIKQRSLTLDGTTNFILQSECQQTWHACWCFITYQVIYNLMIISIFENLTLQSMFDLPCQNFIMWIRYKLKFGPDKLD